MAVFVFVLLLVCIGVPSSSAGNFKVIAETKIPTTYAEFTFKQRVLDDLSDLIKAAEKKFVITTQWIKDTALGALKLVVNCDPIFTTQEKKSLGAIATGIGNILSIIPESFAAVEKWLECKDILQKVPGIFVNNCTLGWVLAFAKTLSDRTCINSKGKIKQEFAPADIVKHCSKCRLKDPKLDRIGVEPKFTIGGSISIGGNASAGGSICVAPHCWGGNAAAAWRRWADYGIVTGSFTRDSFFKGCLPLFSIFTPFINVSLQHEGTGECFYDNQVRKKSAISTYQNELQKYKPKNALVYALYGEKQIQSDILQHGPVQAGIDLYEDFFLYKSGVYAHSPSAERIGHHSVVIDGWGNYNGEKYWSVINTWGPDFGQHGHVWILRGTDECKIESNVIAGIEGKPRAASVPATTGTGKPEANKGTPTPKQDKKEEKKKSDEKSSAILIAPFKIYLLAIIASFVMYFV